ELDLSNNHLEGDIDLSPLSASTFLESIDLSHNWIRSLDTTPLKGKPSLRTFIVNQNPLISLDTEFIHSSKGIETFLVDWTQVTTLDLSPLAACKDLKSLGVPQDKIPELDLYPLMDCQLLESLTVSGINSSYIDLWPLFGLPRLSDLTISSRIQFGRFPLSSIYWPLGLESIRHRKSSSFLREDMHQEGFGIVRDRFQSLYEQLNPLARYHLRVAFIEFFDLGHFQGFDGDLLEIIHSIDDSMTFEEAHLFLNDVISRSMINQVKGGGSTHFIDLNQAHSRPVFAVIASEIVESRRREMNCVSLIKSDEGFDLTELWYTVYGQEVLSALGIGSSTDDAGILRIRHELKKVGIESFGNPDDCDELSPKRLSDELRAYLRFLAIRTSLLKN
ncbi:MAG: hypothetical protein JW779_11425, partial [Candidatus Thorarchaeota archaeon]|nr:hypothetical protein [Candidatus Thorarchaeota archaeon]